MKIKLWCAALLITNIAISNPIIKRLPFPSQKAFQIALISIIANTTLGEIRTRHLPYLKTFTIITKEYEYNYSLNINYRDPNGSYHHRQADLEKALSIFSPPHSLSSPIQQKTFFEKIWSKSSSNHQQNHPYHPFPDNPGIVSKIVADLNIPEDEKTKIAAIIHGIRPGIIISNPEDSLIVRYHNERKRIKKPIRNQ